MGVTRADAELLRRKAVSNPKADELEQHFMEFLEWCQANDKPLLKGYWISYLNITKQTYYNWSRADKNVEFSDEEINDRITLIKKIDTVLENGMTSDLLGSKYPTGIIFYLKNAFKWRDKSEDENQQINISVGAVAPKKRKEDSKK